MSKFKITWPDGTEEEITQEDCSTVEEYEMCRFGSSRNPDTKVELIQEAPETDTTTSTDTDTDTDK